MKRIEFNLTVRKPTPLEVTATALYLVGCLEMYPSVPRPAVIPVVVAQIAAYIAAFAVAPALLRRPGAPK